MTVLVSLCFYSCQWIVLRLHVSHHVSLLPAALRLEVAAGTGWLQSPIRTTCLRAPQFAIQRAVLDRLRHVRGRDVRVAAEIGDGAGDLEEAIVGAGGEAELLDGGTAACKLGSLLN